MNRYLNRIRLADTAGTLSAAAAVGATALVGDFNTKLPTMTAGADHVRLTVVNASAQKQTVDVYSHAAGSNTVSITPPLAIALGIGDAWSCDITTTDFLRGPRFAPPNVSGYHQEFEADDDTGLPPSGWSWLARGTANFRVENGAGILSHPGSADGATKAVVRAKPAEAAWEVEARLSAALLGGGLTGFGLLYRDSVADKNLYFLVATDGTVRVQRFSPLGTVGAVDATPTVGLRHACALRLRRNSATSYDFEWSPDGRVWASVLAAFDASAYLAAPDQVGVVAHTDQAAALEVAIEHFRIFV